MYNYLDETERYMSRMNQLPDRDINRMLRDILRDDKYIQKHVETLFFNFRIFTLVNDYVLKELYKSNRDELYEEVVNAMFPYFERGLQNWKKKTKDNVQRILSLNAVFVKYFNTCLRFNVLSAIKDIEQGKIDQIKDDKYSLEEVEDPPQTQFEDEEDVELDVLFQSKQQESRSNYEKLLELLEQKWNNLGKIQCKMLVSILTEPEEKSQKIIKRYSNKYNKDENDVRSLAEEYFQYLKSYFF